MPPHPPADLQAFAQEALTLVNAETAIVALAEADGTTVYYAAGVGKHAAAIVGKRGATATSGLCGVAFQSDRPVLVCQTQGDARVRQDQVQALGITTALAVAIVDQQQVLGALMVLNRPDGSEFDTAAEQELASYAMTIAPQISHLAV